GLKNENGDEFSLLAEVYLEEEKSNEDVFQDIQNILKDQPSYKNVTKVIIRTEPFVKTTTNKIKR
ncbi:MAG TPA: AMP-dependent synthetase, partial [Clostridiales bacterium]|nr:AMP-dependent synthetase [Clostridiales bacterium]